MDLMIAAFAATCCIWAFFLAFPFLETVAASLRNDSEPSSASLRNDPAPSSASLRNDSAPFSASLRNDSAPFSASLRNDSAPSSASLRKHDYACIITAYRQAGIAEELVESLLTQTFPNYHIYLVADACQTEQWHFQHDRLTVLFPSPPLHLKVKSIAFAVERFIRPHDYVVVFDADNLAHPRFLEEINLYAGAGYPAVQGQRTAKNLDTPYARADAIGEYYKNYVERYLPWKLGASSVISGSGMAVETGLYKAYLSSPEIQQGQHRYKRMLQEDKILQNFLLRKNVRIGFARRAVVYDEKVASAAGVETQRSRWLYSYFQNTPNALGLLRRGLLNGSFNQWYFGLITIAPPMFIQLFGGFALAAAAWWILPWAAGMLLVATLVFLLNILLVLRLAHVPKGVWQAVWQLPWFVYRQVRALFKMTDPDRNFRPTEHSRKVKIDEVIQSQD